MRTSDKKNREPQKVLGVLESYFVPIPEIAEWVVYDTGTVRKGHSLLLGGD